MRIVGGSLRGRPLAAPEGRDVRPTSDRARESIFNILAHGRAAVALDGARVLDAFAGTGAMGLEALSRGAVHVTFIDIGIAPARANVKALDVVDRATLIPGDALDPRPADRPCDVAFLDPPYRSGLAAPALVALRRAGWIGSGTVCVVELAARESLPLPEGFTHLDQRRYGAARVVFLKANGD